MSLVSFYYYTTFMLSYCPHLFKTFKNYGIKRRPITKKMVGFIAKEKPQHPIVKVNLFSQILAHISREKFHKLSVKHQSDKHVKGLKSWTHLVSMLFCHIGGAASVSDISNGLNSTTGNLSHLGVFRVACKSSLSYMNAHQSHKIFKDFYFQLLEELISKHSSAKKGLQQLKRKIYLLDASIIPLYLDVFDWAAYRRTKGAVKLRDVLDYEGCLPVCTAH